MFHTIESNILLSCIFHTFHTTEYCVLLSCIFDTYYTFHTTEYYLYYLLSHIFYTTTRFTITQNVMCDSHIPYFLHVLQVSYCRLFMNYILLSYIFYTYYRFNHTQDIIIFSTDIARFTLLNNVYYYLTFLILASRFITSQNIMYYYPIFATILYFHTKKYFILISYFYRVITHCTS